MSKLLADGFTEAALSTIASTYDEPEIITKTRREAFARHLQMTGPILDVEAWKHTDLKGFAADAFTPAAELCEIEGAEAVRAAGGIVAPLHEAILDPRVAAAFERLSWAESEGFFTSLALAFHTGGLVVLVPRAATIEAPVILRRSIGAGRSAVFPLTLFLVEELGSATLIERIEGGGFDGAESLAVHPTWVEAGQSAQATLLTVQDYAQDVWHFAQTRAVAGRDATVRTLTATIGARSSRTVTEARLEGQGSSAEMLGCYFGDHDQRIDHRTLQHHIGPRTSSDLYYKGALQGRSQAVYSGLVAIDHDAEGADAQQKNRNLLLSREASADASPFLEILTSEVERATHGVSVGRADAEVLFYLRSRGLPPDLAQRLFVKGFFQEVIDRVGDKGVRDVLEDLVEAELELGEIDA